MRSTIRFEVDSDFILTGGLNQCTKIVVTSIRTYTCREDDVSSIQSTKLEINTTHNRHEYKMEYVLFLLSLYLVNVDRASFLTPGKSLFSKLKCVSFTLSPSTDTGEL